MFSNDEIQKRIQNRYIERVSSRLKKMRKLVLDRNWNSVKAEVNQLHDGAQNFGFTNLAEDVQKAIEVLNKANLTRTAIDHDAKNTLEDLFKKLDRFLVEEDRF